MRRLAISLVTSALAACATIDVQTDYDPARKPQLASYRTFAWEHQPVRNDARMENPIVRDLVQGAVERSLAVRGLRPAAEGETPDVWLAWGAALREKLSYDAVPGYWGYAVGGWWGPGYGVGAPIGSAREYQEGTLVVDLVDAKSNELVWRGLAQTELNADASAEDRAERIEASVRRMFDDFPPG